MAAKLCEEISPSVERMQELVDDKFSVKLAVKKILKLEMRVIRTLDFNLQRVSPITFLERFFRLFGLDDVS